MLWCGCVAPFCFPLKTLLFLNGDDDNSHVVHLYRKCVSGKIINVILKTCTFLLIDSHVCDGSMTPILLCTDEMMSLSSSLFCFQLGGMVYSVLNLTGVDVITICQLHYSVMDVPHLSILNL